MQQADASWGVVVNGVITAQCSAWWSTSKPQFGEHVIGVIGNYRADNDESADVLISHALGQLASQGCTFVFGPMDQNTWHDYRFIIESDGRPGFFLEPHGSERGALQFNRHGFYEVARYFSASAEDLSLRSNRIDRLRPTFLARGIQIRALEKHRFIAEMKQIHRVATEAFRDHFLYTSICEDQFIDMYRPLESLVSTDLILLAEQAGRVVGFCFAVPDLLHVKRNEPLDTIIIKTFGVIPGREFAGLGQLLLEEVQHRASAVGYRRAVHALVAEGGPVERISGRYATPFRRYALFGKELCG
jgi:GNAT superfamily N-acetyltransferase